MQDKRLWIRPWRIVAVAIAGVTPLVVVYSQLVDADQLRQQDNRDGATFQQAVPLEPPQKDCKADSLQDARKTETERQPKQKESGREFRLQTEGQVRDLIKTLPDTSPASDLQLRDVRLKSIPDERLKQMADCASGTKSLILGGGDLPAGEAAPEVSDLGMEHISQLRSLKTLCLACRFSATGFAHLSRLRELETLGLDYPTINANEFFATVSKLPNIRTIGVRYADFSQPIDTATYKAIASLNGRLESLSFGEWGETTIHRSMIPALAEIESLTSLQLGNFYGVSAADMEPIRRKLKYLSIFGPTTKDTKGVLTVRDYCMRDRCPVQFRKVESPTAMIALLQFILGEREADKVRRGVVRRRASLEKEEDFTKSGLGLASILEKSFGVKIYPNAESTLNQIPHAYPELDKTIRRYLSGKDLKPSE